MAPPPKLTAADHAMIHALTVLVTLPSGIGGDDAELDDRFRTILSEVMPQVSRDNAALRPLVAGADRVLAARGGLGGVRHLLREPVNAWNRTRLVAAVGAMGRDAA